MPARILKAREEEGEFVVQILLDDTKVSQAYEERRLADGTAVQVVVEGVLDPDMNWVVTETFPPDHNPEAAIEATLVKAKGELAKRRRDTGQPNVHVLEGHLVELNAFVPTPKQPAEREG